MESHFAFRERLILFLIVNFEKTHNISHEIQNLNIAIVIGGITPTTIFIATKEIPQKKTTTRPTKTAFFFVWLSILFP
jgi:hypothetical protein